MKNKTIVLPILILFVVIFTFFGNKIQAQKSNGRISSDLLLDLEKAKQNPSPDQQKIVSLETTQAEIVTVNGQTTDITPDDQVAPQAQTESESNAINPEQSSSEEIIVPVQTTNQNSNDSLEPTITSPNDNAAPEDNSGNPALPAPTSIESESPNTVTQEPEISQPGSNDTNSPQSISPNPENQSVEGASIGPQNAFIRWLKTIFNIK